MNIRELTKQTNKILNNLSNSNRIELSEEVMQDIHDFNAGRQAGEGSEKISDKRSYSAKQGSGFAIPDKASSFPFIESINDNGTVTLTTFEPKTNKTKSGTALNTKALKPTRLGDFKGEIPAINKTSFSNGIDLDNFKLLNVSDAPLNKDQLKMMLEHGKILPVEAKAGVFMPNFGVDGNVYSLEWEGRFKESGDFNDHVTAPVKQEHGVHFPNLMSFDMGDTKSYSAAHDNTIASRPGRSTSELRLGAAPMGNLIYGTHIMFDAWKKQGIVDSRDMVMDSSSGMHINTTLPNLGKDMGAASSYLNHIGTVMSSLSKTHERWESGGSYLGIATKYDENRKDFRMEPSTSRMEYRYPASVADSGYIGSQLAMVSKMTGDMMQYIEHKNGQAKKEVLIPGSTQLRGKQKAIDTLFNPLHRDKDPLMMEWFNSFMNTAGIKDPVSKNFVLGMNKRCGASRGQ